MQEYRQVEDTCVQNITVAYNFFPSVQSKKKKKNQQKKKKKKKKNGKRILLHSNKANVDQPGTT